MNEFVDKNVFVVESHNSSAPVSCQFPDKLPTNHRRLLTVGCATHTPTICRRPWPHQTKFLKGLNWELIINKSVPISKTANRSVVNMMFADRRLARKSSQQAAAGIYYDQRKELQYSDYRISDRQRSRTATPMRFAGETKSLHGPPPPFIAGYGRPRPSPPPPPHQAPGAYLHGRSLSSNAAGSLLYHSVDSGGSGVDSRYVEHIYESPTCVRKDFNGEGGAGVNSLQYFDVDSERPVGRGNGQESI